MTKRPCDYNDTGKGAKALRLLDQVEQNVTLPWELIEVEIARHLPFETIIKMMSTCQRLAATLPMGIEELPQRLKPFLSDEHLSRFPALTALDVGAGERIGLGEVVFVPTRGLRDPFPRLLVPTNVGVAQFTRLRSLTLTNCRTIGDNGLALLTSLTALKIGDTWAGPCYQITDAGIAKLHNLRTLELGGTINKTITNDAIFRLTTLTDLAFRGRISYNYVRRCHYGSILQDLPLVQSLALKKSKFTRTDDELRYLPNLTSLDLCGLTFDTEVSLRYVSSTLRGLCIRQCKAFQVGHLERFSETLTSLTLDNIWSANLGEVILGSAFHKLRALDTLIIAHTKVAPAELDALTSLTLIGFTGFHLNNRRLPRLQNLRSLNLYENVELSTEHALDALPSLTSLNLDKKSCLPKVLLDRIRRRQGVIIDLYATNDVHCRFSGEERSGSLSTSVLY